ncbi:MAG: DegV family protein [Clostridia bacterium]|nr:DegV family protein [Clostridia bacterium]
MEKFAIFTDSSCNLSSEELDKYGIEPSLPMHVYIDGVEHLVDRDWTNFTPKEYYDIVRSSAKFSSSQVSAAEYEAAFRKALDEGRDILSLSCCNALSGSVLESIAAKEKLQAEFPDRKIYCVDSYNCCYSLAMILIEAAKKRDAGMSIDDVYAWVMEHRENFNEAGTVENLSYLRRAGRISASAAFFGGLLSVKPMIVYDETGHNVAVEKVRGRKASLIRSAEFVRDYADLDANNNVCIAHADCEDDAKTVAEAIQGFFPDKEIDFHFGVVNQGVGSPVGPGTIILAFYGDPKIRQLNK